MEELVIFYAVMLLGLVIGAVLTPIGRRLIFMPVNEYKEVDFETYCLMCSHYDLEETEEPCNECLDCSTRYATHVPLNYDGKKLVQGGGENVQTV